MNSKNSVDAPLFPQALRGLLLAAAILGPSFLSGLAEQPATSVRAGEWDVLASLDHDERTLIEGYAAQARQLDRLALELSRRFPGPLLELQIRRDLSRLRWRSAGPLARRWSEAVVCPEDRRAFREIEGVVAKNSARGQWLPLAVRGDRLLSAPHWAGRALLIRPDGTIVRLRRLD